MLGDASEVNGSSTLSCDVCIVGAGAAGITLAQELAGTSLEVILLESGGLTVERPTQSLNVAELHGAPQFSAAGSRLRAFGGTTGHWDGMCRPLDTFDFEERAWVPNSGWPISRAHLDAYYERAHSICDLGSYDYSEDAWPKVLGVDSVLREAGARLKLLQLSPPTRFGRKFRKLLEDAANVRVLLHSTVREIVSAPGARTIERVDVTTLAGHRFRVRARIFVLACGGIENARMLLLSTSASPGGLGNASGWVGRCFMDHPAALPLGTLLLLRKESVRLVQEQNSDGISVMVGLGFDLSVQRKNKLLNNLLYVGPPRAIKDSKKASASDRRTMEFLSGVAGSTTGGLVAECWLRSEQVPHPESRITLSDDVDRLGQRSVRIDWRLTDLDYESLDRSYRLYAHILGRAGLGRIHVVPWIGRKPPRWWDHMKAGWHHMGTTRMATGPSQGVVDVDGKIFGVENLFVAGSSVFPTGGVANPTLTIVALTVRLADHLKTQLG